ncbi:hypothetical protein EC973_009465 [Apophysomyces ossiformis]|uniref:Uncharacterized protein n=1 Tax=Apophysomyces ossiformis TaxID=679940 RepID=A0A8H7BJS5_9FUNG|nr:hypothetical protein EC973_009465 [Apophysomyces ossiformis]
MASLSALEYYTRAIATISNGIFAGFAITMGSVSIPIVRNSPDPPRSFLTAFHTAKKIALIGFAVTASHFASYYYTKDPRDALCGVLCLVPIISTGFTVMPINNQLVAMAEAQSNDKKKAMELLAKWSRYHWYRVVCVLSSFVLSVLR